MAAKGIEVKYECRVIEYTRPARPSKYTPDFELPNGIILETKGRFTTADRQKHKHIKAQYPHLDIRFVFSNPKNRISKQSKTTYAKWCDQYGFKWSGPVVPDEWIE